MRENTLHAAKENVLPPVGAPPATSPKKVLLRLRSRMLVSAVLNCCHFSFAIRMIS